MSRVYPETVIKDVAAGTAAYIASFRKALASTRIAYGAPLPPGTSLLDFLVNVFDTSDPWLPEEDDLTATWSVSTDRNWTGWQDSKLHRIPLSFRAAWPTPVAWAQTVDWHPFPQNKPRVYEKNLHRTRRPRFVEKP